MSGPRPQGFWHANRFRGGLLAVATLVAVSRLAAVDLPPSPDVVYGALFQDVERARVFADQKTFADAIPLSPPATIVAEYNAAKRSAQGKVDLRAFVRDHFRIEAPSEIKVLPSATVEQHIDMLWSLLTRTSGEVVAGSSQLALPHPYVVPGGRFREIYYWDSYFTMLGLRESGKEELIESMVEDFAYFIRTYGHIPNGGRTYYLSRSQPPFFALMVELLAHRYGDDAYRRYAPELQAEYDYWSDKTAPTHHVVHLPDGSVLSRYYDQLDTPRPEAYADDEALAAKTWHNRSELLRNVRSTCESGWDFSSRWMADPKSLASLETLALVPVDLNCLLYKLETVLAHSLRLSGEPEKAADVERAAEARREAILKYCWSPRLGFFCDYNFIKRARTERLTLAGDEPLFFGIANKEQADAVMAVIRDRFLKAGGVVTTLEHTGQQWDAPNGWAPLEWLTIEGLKKYGYNDLAAEITKRWLALNDAVYQRTGKLMEKYDVENLSLPAGGGEYPGQDGFGWTNGVLLALRREQ